MKVEGIRGVGSRSSLGGWGGIDEDGGELLVESSSEFAVSIVSLLLVSPDDVGSCWQLSWEQCRFLAGIAPFWAGGHPHPQLVCYCTATYTPALLLQ